MLLLKTGPQASLGSGPLAPAEFTFLCDEGPPADWHVRGFRLVEAISEPYRLSLDLLTADLAVDPDRLLGARCTLHIHRGAEGRTAHGLITRVRTLGVASGRLRVGVDVEPALALLADRTDTRFWQDRTAADILRDVLHAPLRELGCSLDLRLGATDLATREYCVQYRESDLDFAARLMHEEGLVYYFIHSPDDPAETLVVVDSTANAPELVHPLPAVPFVPRHTGAAHCQTLAAFDWQSRLGTTAVALRDWDWQDTEASPFARSRDGKDLRGRVRARFAHDERRLHRDDGSKRARLDLEGRTATLDRGAGDSDVVEMLPGHVVTLQGLERPDLDGDYLLIRVTHRGDAPDEERFAADRPRSPRYTNSFECIRRNTPFRARTAPARPRVHGPHTAIVVGPPGEEIHTDEHGRIKVHFHWDRISPFDDTASCWIRVVQRWAGPSWGALFIPRIGMEVIVEFLDGDPDRPVVTGCVYNGQNHPPYPLPDQKTKSTIKTETSPGGGGFNEIRFEDAAGSEEIFIHGQLDMNSDVKRDTTRKGGRDDSSNIGRHQNDEVGVNRTAKVGNNETLTVGVDQTLSVGSNQSITVGANQTLSVGANQSESVGGNQTVNVAGNQTVSVAGNQSTAVAGSATLAISGSTTTNVSGSATSTVNGSSTESISGTLTLTANGAATVTFAAAHDLTVGAARTTNVAAGDTLNVGAALSVTAAQITLTGGGSVIDIGPGGISITSGGVISITGATVNINS
jgi:type VI secretion system secreted protein VgrG